MDNNFLVTAFLQGKIIYLSSTCPSTWKKKKGKEGWRQNHDANFVRPCGTIAPGNMSLLLFVREGLELSEICIKN